MSLRLKFDVIRPEEDGAVISSNFPNGDNHGQKLLLVCASANVDFSLVFSSRDSVTNKKRVFYLTCLLVQRSIPVLLRRPVLTSMSPGSFSIRCTHNIMPIHWFFLSQMENSKQKRLMMIMMMIIMKKVTMEISFSPMFINLNSLTLSQTTNFRPSKLKEFAADNIKFD